MPTPKKLGKYKGKEGDEQQQQQQQVEEQEE